jgi:hypothetical protein
MPEAATSSEASGLWLATLQRFAERSAHDVRNTMNGVAVNLEVVRSRSTRDGLAASAVASFATTASDQFEVLSAAVEALLALARPARLPVDVHVILGQLASLGGRSGEPGVEPPAVASSGESLTSAEGDVVRLVLGTAFLAVLDSGASARYDVMARDGAVTVRCEVAGEIRIDPLVKRIGLSAGITMLDVDGATEIRFPGLRS